MLVTEDNFHACLKRINHEKYFSFDLETTGLRPYHGDKIFAAIIAIPDEVFYFNFNHEADHLGNFSPHPLPISYLAALGPLMGAGKSAFLANAPFDMGFALLEGLEFKCTIVDVLVQERLLYNDLMRLNLEVVAKRHGHAKSDAVEEYITEHKLWEWVEIPGKEKRSKNKFYHKVPFEIMHPYGETDGKITLQTGLSQIKRRPDYEPPRPTPMHIYAMEANLTPVLFRMKTEGILIDTKFSKEQADIEGKKYEALAREFHDKTGVVFIDSAKCLAPLFLANGLVPPKTDKGNDSFPDWWLEKLNHPLAKLVQGYRTHSKIANTYYRNFLWYADSQGIIRADAKQGGTRTGRLSYADPNLQNIPDNEIRRAILAPPGWCLLSIDYDQQEYKMMLDYAKQMDVINAIMNDGLDVHAATALMMGVERNPAKTLNFMLLYGGGTVKLAMALFPVTVGENELWSIWRLENDWRSSDAEKEAYRKIPKDVRELNLSLLLKAQDLKNRYFERLPKIGDFTDRVKETATKQGYIETWAGRRLFFKKNFAYKSPNGLIQGGAADVSKYGMIALDKFLASRKSKMLVQIHDELIFKLHPEELEIVPELQFIMEKTFPHEVIPLTTSASYSWKNLGELISVKETGNSIQREVSA